MAIYIFLALIFCTGGLLLENYLLFAALNAIWHLQRWAEIKLWGGRGGIRLLAHRALYSPPSEPSAALNLPWVF